MKKLESEIFTVNYKDKEYSISFKIVERHDKAMDKDLSGADEIGNENVNPTT